MMTNNRYFKITEPTMDKATATVVERVADGITQIDFIPSINGLYMVKFPEDSSSLLFPKSLTSTFQVWYSDSNNAKRFLNPQTFGSNYTFDGVEYIRYDFFNANTPDDLFVIVEVLTHDAGEILSAYCVGSPALAVGGTKDTATLINWNNKAGFDLAMGESAWFFLDADKIPNDIDFFVETGSKDVTITIHDSNGPVTAEIDENYYTSNTYDYIASTDYHDSFNSTTLPALNGIMYIEVKAQAALSAYPSSASILLVNGQGFESLYVDPLSVLARHASTAPAVSATPGATVEEVQAIVTASTSSLTAVIDAQGTLISSLITTSACNESFSAETLLYAKRLLALTEGKTVEGSRGTIENPSVAIIGNDGSVIQELTVEGNERTPYHTMVIDRSGDVPTSLIVNTVGLSGITSEVIHTTEDAPMLAPEPIRGEA